jgi:hypothetical protein
MDLEDIVTQIAKLGVRSLMLALVHQVSTSG